MPVPRWSAARRPVGLRYPHGQARAGRAAVDWLGRLDPKSPELTGRALLASPLAARVGLLPARRLPLVRRIRAGT
jgi:hypothetical protein